MNTFSPTVYSEEHFSQTLPILALLYLYVPFVCFAIGWLRPVVSIPVVAVTLMCVLRCCQVMPRVWIPGFTWRIVFRFLAVAIVLVFWLYTSGVGSFVWTNRDHLFRNTIFQMLVERPWPVTSNGVEDVPLGASPTMLCYYIGFWLPAAALGKVTSFNTARLAIFVWAFLGIFITYSLLCSRFRRVLIWPALVFILYSGSDAIGVAVKNLYSDNPIPFWSLTSNFEPWSAYQYSSMTSQLYWVYNQAIPAWVATALLLSGVPNGVVLFFAALLMINATFPFVGLCLLAGCQAIDKHLCTSLKPLRVSGLFAVVRSFATIPNTLGVLLIGLPTYLYLRENTAGGLFGLYYHVTYPLFIAFEVALPFLPLIYTRRRSPLLWMVFVALAVIPFVRVGCSIDFCMRVSIPFLFIAMVWTMDDLAKASLSCRWRHLVVLLTIVGIGTFTPMHEFSRTIVNTRTISNMQQYYKRANKPPAQILGFFLTNPRDAVYAAPAENTLFRRYLSKESSP